MAEREWPGCLMEALESRLCLSATWVVIPPGGVRDGPVVEQPVPLAAVAGLSHAAQRANATAGGGFNCWVVRLDPAGEV